MYQDDDVGHYFSKKFTFKYNSTWTLPSEAYKHPPQEIKTLQAMKATLNACKGQLSQYSLTEWSNHTKFTDPSSLIIPSIKNMYKVELLTQAWCKFYECLHTYPIVTVQSRALSSLHLCEAPGAFVSALNYYLFKKHPGIKWKWKASTLNPYYEGNSVDSTIFDDRLIRHTLPNWEFGPDSTGDLRELYNHDSLVANCKGAMLVTADGSINCMNDPGEQERHVHVLHYCEVTTALKVLGEHGNFVLKLFTMYEHETVCLLYLLNGVFREVNVFKPCASKSGNSEVYVICIDYHGYNQLPEGLRDTIMHGYRSNGTVMFPLEAMESGFVGQVEECAKYFMDLQRERIDCNIRLFRTKDQDSIRRIAKVKERVADEYLNRFRILRKIGKQRRLTRYDRNCLSVREEWDFKRLNETPPDMLTIRTGLSIKIVHNSEFGHISPKSRPDNRIYEEIKAMLPTTFTTITGADFPNESPQHIMQRKCFSLIMEQCRNSHGIVIYGVPFLTRFLVGIVYLLACGFETVLVCKGGAIIFSQRRDDSINRVRSHFDTINDTYADLKCEQFSMDILEVVDKDLLKNGEFYKAICMYNKGLCS